MVIQFTAQADWKPEDLAMRINDVINGSAIPVQYSATDRKWMLGTHNDWWLRIDNTTRRCQVSNRGGQTREQMEALAIILRWRVHLLDAEVSV